MLAPGSCRIWELALRGEASDATARFADPLTLLEELALLDPELEKSDQGADVC